MHKSLVYYTLLLIVGIFLAYVWSDGGVVLSHYMKWCLIGLLFISGLKIRSREIVQLSHRIVLILKLVIIRMMIIPIVTWMVTGMILPEYQLAFVLLTLVPVGVSTPVFVSMLGGNGSISLALTVLTGLLTPLIMPLFFSLVQLEVMVKVSTMIWDLFLVLILPVGIAEMIQNIFPKAVQRFSSQTQIITYLLLLIVLWGTFSAQWDALIALPTLVFVKSLLFSCVLFLGLGVVGWIVSAKSALKDRIAVSASFILMNYALAIYVGNTFFSDDVWVVVVTVLASIPWNLSIIIFDFYLHLRKLSR